MTMKQTIRFDVIFQSKNGRGAKRWLDFCRETAPAQTRDAAEFWGNRQADLLAKRIGCECRARVEEHSEYDWSEH